MFCAQAGTPVADTVLDDAACEACAAKMILEGELFCPSCGTVFRIDDGIACLVTDQLTGDQPANRDKANEMRARDDQAPVYDNLGGLKLITRFEEPKFLEYFEAGPDNIVIELGAGTGRFSQIVSSLVGELVAVDFSIESLKRSRLKFESANTYWVQGDINHLPFRDAACDHAFSCQVFEHLPGAIARDAGVGEAARIIKGAGTFIISVYRDSWFWRSLGVKEGYHKGGIYYYRMNSNEFLDLLTRRFEIQEFVPNLGFHLQMAKCIKS